MLCSPSTQRMASATLLLPEPLGPTTAVIPRPYSNVVRLAKLLKPWMESRFRYTVSPPPSVAKSAPARPPARRLCWASRLLCPSPRPSVAPGDAHLDDEPRARTPAASSTVTYPGGSCQRAWTRC